MAENYLSTEEVAKRLKITNAEVVAAVQTGKLRGFKDGQNYKFRDEDIRKYQEDLVASSSSGSGIGLDDYDLNSGSSDINSTLDKDSMLGSGDSDVTLASTSGLSSDSDVLSVSDSDTGLVLGEVSASGSSLLGEGSGISLLGADDSGITLSDTSDVLELGEDVLGGSSVAAGLSGSLVASLTGTSIVDEDFSLGANEGEDEDDDSGSQVIELAEDEPTDGVSPDFFTNSGSGGGSNAPQYPSAIDPALLAELENLRRPEKPYSVWNLLGLIFCFIFLAVTMMFTIDLLRNMWSWDKPTQFSSSMMDWVIDNIVKKVQSEEAIEEARAAEAAAAAASNPAPAPVNDSGVPGGEAAPAAEAPPAE